MAVQQRLQTLAERHQALEADIKKLEAKPSVDPVEVRGLKRRKLAIKDEIQRIKTMH